MLATRETPSDPSEPAERRRDPRYRLNAAYTQVRVIRRDGAHNKLCGHAYDLSRGGVRFEVDAPLVVGEVLDLELMLPGREQAWVGGTGTVVRRHDVDEVGPIRFGVMFTDVDRDAIDRYLDAQQ